MKQKYAMTTHRGSFLAPECSWWECEDCGDKSEPI